MEQEFYQFGVKYSRWEHNGHIYEAVKEQVEFFGKPFFEWKPTEDELKRKYERLTFKFSKLCLSIISSTKMLTKQPLMQSLNSEKQQMNSNPNWKKLSAHAKTSREQFSSLFFYMFNSLNFTIMLITSLLSPKSGRPVANQFCINMPNGKRIFQSYNSIICIIEADGKIKIAHDAWLSRTTKKYLAVFLGLTTQELNKLLPKLEKY